MKAEHWWQPLLAVMVLGVSGVMFMGIRTYRDAPPIPDFTDPDGAKVVSNESILAGQSVFQKYALMDYGSMFGDGGGRGPDFTAEALHQTALYMNEHYQAGLRGEKHADLTDYEVAAVQARVQNEIKANAYDASTGSVALTDGQAYACRGLVKFYHEKFKGTAEHSFEPSGYITNDEEIKDLAAFFFWGSWVCGARRPGKDYSYTHNWPYDAFAGNTPSAGVTLWSVLAAGVLVLVLGAVLFFYGRYEKHAGWQPGSTYVSATDQNVDSFMPTPTQRATYKFFAVAAILFFVQMLAGVLTIHDFVRFTTFFGVNIAHYLPVTIVRTWHLQLSVFWIATCWIGASIFILPIVSKEEPKGQLGRVNLLFWMLVVTVAGSLVGEFLGPKGFLGEYWRAFGHQGWELFEQGKVWQFVLFAAFALWCWIVFLGVKPALREKHPSAMPGWLAGSIACILVLFCSGFIAGPKTNFVIADFWRWCTIHMWAEAFFEVFTTVIIAYFMVLMGLVNRHAAVRVIYIATLLFLGSGMLGIAHNFYWNAKPVVTLAIGSVFSTLQVVPLILLTLEAWKFRHLPTDAMRRDRDAHGGNPTFGQEIAFLFLVAVNFWNFLGAGVFGFLINLPIVNYYEHGTYLTVNHGHSALMGVYGNLSVAAMIFCARYLVKPALWRPQTLKISFWSMNLGLLLMVVLDLFPAGVLQFLATVEQGLWYSRSQAFVYSETFQTLTWLRAVGGVMFFVGGVIPLMMFMVSRWRSIKQPWNHEVAVREGIIDTVPGPAVPVSQPLSKEME